MGPSMRRTFAFVVVALVMFVGKVGSAAEPDAWSKRYDAARSDIIDGRFGRAEIEFRALAAEAKSEGQRMLAIEMARLSAEYGARSAQGRPAPAAPAAPLIRSTDELTLLYASSFLYGAGVGLAPPRSPRPPRGRRGRD